MPVPSVPSIPSTPSHWDPHGVGARVRRAARRRQIRERQIHERLTAAGWRAGTSIGPAVQRMAPSHRQALIRLLEADVPGGPT